MTISNMVVSLLSQQQAQLITRHAQQEAPLEACGLLAGHGATIERVIPVGNVADDPRHHYVMDKKDLARYLPELVSDGLDLIGFYHSHPDGTPVFSETDRREAYWENHVYLIVGLKHRQPRLAAWTIRNGEVYSVNLQIDAGIPDLSDDTLSSRQKAAIITGGLIILVMMIALSLHLLPPAPPVP